jgi:aryl-alcohol dehydrogenase-like predicted oxidoreductase
MERRILGKTGVEVAVLGFGCGAVGGLMVRGTAADQERAVARALALGINYFDTAPIYGDGESEKNLGRVLKTLRPNVVVGTKVRIPDEARGRAAQAVTASLEASLGRLGLERVDLLQLHNLISEDGRAGTIGATAALDQVVPALDTLRRQGKIRFFGITALGDTPALHRVIDARVLDTAQVCFNAQSERRPAAAGGISAHDFGEPSRGRARGWAPLHPRPRRGRPRRRRGTPSPRHPVRRSGSPPGPSYAADVERARRLEVLVREGHAGSLVEAGIRFALTNEGMTTVLVGYSTFEHLEYAAAAAEKGPLPRAALDRLAVLWQEKM